MVVAIKWRGGVKGANPHLKHIQRPMPSHFNKERTEHSQHRPFRRGVNSLPRRGSDLSEICYVLYLAT